MKRCKICKKEFIPYRNHQKYCSKECYKQGFGKNYMKQWVLKNQEKVKKQRESYKEKSRKLDSKRRKTSKRKKYMKEYCKKYVNNKLKTNLNYKIKCYLRHRIYMALNGNPKLSTTMKLVGCSIKYLKKHLEKQFKIGMNWSNYGKWHIDHIRPCASFDLSKPSEQKKCFYYTNLQPLWAEENLRKHCKIMEN
jgi:hypothetical protein